MYIDILRIAKCRSLFFHFLSRYEQAENVERELEHMTEQIKSIIETVNSSQVIVLGLMINLRFYNISRNDNRLAICLGWGT